MSGARREHSRGPAAAAAAAAAEERTAGSKRMRQTTLNFFTSKRRRTRTPTPPKPTTGSTAHAKRRATPSPAPKPTHSMAARAEPPADTIESFEDSEEICPSPVADSLLAYDSTEADFLAAAFGIPDDSPAHTAHKGKGKGKGRAGGAARAEPEATLEATLGTPPDSPDEIDAVVAAQRATAKRRKRKTVRKGMPASSLPPVRIAESHTVLFQAADHPKAPPKPHGKHVDKWDQHHVRLPCSEKSRYRKGPDDSASRWALIEETLLVDMASSYDLEEAVLTYNRRYSHSWDFGTLHIVCKAMPTPERQAFFKHTLPAIVALALRLPQLVTRPIPLLKTGKSKTITLSQEQLACLLANAFLCTFPRRNAFKSGSEYSQYPSINFNKLFSSKTVRHKLAVRRAKVQCLLHYFRRVTDSMPPGCVTFQRRSLDSSSEWDKCDVPLTSITAVTEGTIEDDGDGMLQMDFANQFIGGGVLGNGAVQEEIRFLICPELIVSRLFTERLDNDEAVIITGAERFCDYEGYASSFVFVGDHADITPRDKWGRVQTQVVAIDALRYSSLKGQLKRATLSRETLKAYSGFANDTSATSPSVATGNWGCGVFGGDPRVKALVQLMAASAANRDVVYFTFGDEDLADDIRAMARVLEETDTSVSRLFLILLRFYHIHNLKPRASLVDFVVEHARLGNDNGKGASDTDDGGSDQGGASDTELREAREAAAALLEDDSFFDDDAEAGPA